VGRLAEVYGQPFGNSSVVPTYCCAEMARADGVSTMLGGDGGDELYGGNQRYATQTLFGYYDTLPAVVRKRVLEPLLLRDWARKVMPFRKASRYIEQALVPMPQRLQTYNYLHLFGHASVFESDFLERIDPDRTTRELAEAYAATKAHTLLNKMMALDLKYTLADNDLPKVVEMCAAAGVDVAFPFLSTELVEFAARLPAAQKVSRLRLRYFFKKALADFLPREILRKQKHGFGMPFGDWLPLDEPLRELAFDSLASLKTRGIIRPDFIDSLRGERLSQHPNYYGGFIWILMILELWLQWQQTLGSPAAGRDISATAPAGL
jgi:asparagine synthase (glutamine-hydrolysing)